MDKLNETIITYFGKPTRVKCDRKCNKAWGINNRPSLQLSDDEDDIVWLSDEELGEAPTDPGTYEGGDAKPLSPDHFPNRWCVRECERCEKSNPDEHGLPLVLKDWSKRVFNISQSKTAEEVGEDE